MDVAVVQSGSGFRISSDQSAVLERTIKAGFPWLLFPAGLESDFLRACEARRFLVMVVAGLSAIALFGFMLLADYLLSPGALSLAVVLRLLVFPLCILCGLYVLRRLRMPALNEWMVAVSGILAAVLEALILLDSAGSWGVARVVELNLLVVFTCCIARFWPAVLMALVSCAIHGHVVTTMPDETGMLPFVCTLLLISSTAFVLYGNYRLEHDERMAFLMDTREQALNEALSEAHERLMRMATTDALTKVANRRYFETFLGECWQCAQAQGRTLSLIMVDVDYFKPYNDRYGHQAGDRCLVAVAEALGACIRRPGDLVARWGGEEFAVVLMDADAEVAAAAAERIRQAVAALHIPHGTSSCADHVTVSGGRATCRPEQGMNWSHLVNLADAALYRAKSAGRNRVDVEGQGDVATTTH